MTIANWLLLPSIGSDPGGTPVGPTTFALLKEDVSFLLLEDGASWFLLE